MSANDASVLGRVIALLNILFHQGVAVLTVYLITVMFEHLPTDNYTAWHVVLTTIGFIFLILEGLIVFTNHNLYTLDVNRVVKAKIHGVLAGLGSILIIIGIILKIVDKPSNHFESDHAIVGLITLILVAISAIFGILTANAAAVKKILSPVWMKVIHNCLGILTLTLGLASIGLGISKDFFKLLWSTEDTVTAALVGMAVFGLWACYDAFKSLYSNFKTAIGK